DLCARRREAARGPAGRPRLPLANLLQRALLVRVHRPTVARTVYAGRMCLIGFTWQVDPQFDLVVAANRDEFHARPSAPADFWKDAPDLYGGRDLKSGGSWLAVSSRGRFAAVTNVRRMIPPNPNAPSRGELVAGFV